VSQWYSVLFCLLLHQFGSESHASRHFQKLRCETMIYIIFKLLHNLFDLYQVSLSKMAKHWDSFLNDCMSSLLCTDSEEWYACSLYGYGVWESGFPIWNPWLWWSCPLGTSDGGLWIQWTGQYTNTYDLSSWQVWQFVELVALVACILVLVFDCI